MRDDGFTLIETLLALTIFSLIAAGLAATFSSGMGLWSRATTSDFQRNDVILSFESVSKDIRQSLDMPVIGYEGDLASFSFPGLSGNRIVKVAYYFDAGRNMLVRSESRLEDIINKKTTKIEKDILPLTAFSARYLSLNPGTGAYEWKDLWAKQDGIFKAVRFKGRAKNEELQKTVFVPVS